MYHPNLDGIDHINIYSKGKTILGRFLSNFTESPFIHPIDGKFNSIEGYWYWLSCKDERFRKLSGFSAKKLGRALKAKDYPKDKIFQERICQAITIKINNNAEMLDLLGKNKLPLTHYYVFGEKIIESKDGAWILEHIKRVSCGIY